MEGIKKCKYFGFHWLMSLINLLYTITQKLKVETLHNPSYSENFKYNLTLSHDGNYVRVSQLNKVIPKNVLTYCFIDSFSHLNRTSKRKDIKEKILTCLGSLVSYQYL